MSQLNRRLTNKTFQTPELMQFFITMMLQARGFSSKMRLDLPPVPRHVLLGVLLHARRLKSPMPSTAGLRHDGRSAKFRQNDARFRLYRHRSLKVNTRFAAFFKIYQIIQLNFLKFGKFLQILQHLQIFAEFSPKLLIFQTDFLRKF